MSDQWGKRAEDHGKESPMVLLTRIDERLANFLARFDKHEKEDKILSEMISKRIEVLEGDKARIWGGAAVIGFFAATLTKWWPK